MDILKRQMKQLLIVQLVLAILLGGHMAYTVRTTDNALDLGRHTDQNESVNNDIYFYSIIGPGSVWTTFDSLPQGWAGGMTHTEARYKRLGDLMIVQLRLTGVSNAVTKSATLPVAAGVNGVGGSVACLIQDNTGAFVWGWAAVVPGSATINFYTTPNSGAWTAAGTADIYRCMILYEV